MQETIANLQADTCRDLKLPDIDETEFNAASDYWRKLVREMNVAWQVRCGSA